MRNLIGGFVLAAALLGCDRDDSLAVRTQSVPKQPTPSTVPIATMGSSMMPPMPGAVTDPNAEKAIAFDTPAGWTKEPPHSMRVVSFTIDGGAEMIASQFPIFPGSLLENINRWRKQTNLPPAESEADAPTTPITVADVPSKRFQIDSADKRMVLIWTEHNGTWFFKLLGPTKTVEQQAVNFDQFLKSVKWQ